MTTPLWTEKNIIKIKGLDFVTFARNIDLIPFSESEIDDFGDYGMNR